MTNSIPALIDMLLQVTSKPVVGPDGKISMIPDTDFMRYRLLNIPSNNFSAFLLHCIQLKKDIENLKSGFPELSYNVIRKEIIDTVDSYMLSLTGKSSEGGQLIKLLLQDVNTSYHFFRDMSGGRKMLGGFGGMAGDQDRQRQVQEQAPPGGRMA